MIAAVYVALVLPSDSAADEPVGVSPDFDAKIAPLLAGRCLGCHNPSDRNGGLDLTRAESAKAGGDSGAAIEPGEPDASFLWQRIAADEMPPENPLPEAERELIRDWIASGAAWGTDPIDRLRYTTAARAGYDWWALRPLREESGSNPAAARQEPRPPAQVIDSLVAATLDANGLTPSPEADRRTLIRRLTFDLWGLPPSPDEVVAFLADDSPAAYERLVDRLLDSPHYGERWARPWLDVVRFGESQGFERDKVRPNAWPYRDWVIQSLNDDLPYDEFVRMQLAGDVLRPDDPRAIVATGFLVAGPWDEVGQSQQSAAMKAFVRQDELEDYIATIGQTFLGLTIHCARCHDHKFDPISQADYYRLAAALGGVRHGERERTTESGREADSQRRAELAAASAPLATEIEARIAPIRERLLAERTLNPPALDPPAPIARWEFDTDFADSLGGLHGEAHGNAIVADGRLRLADGGYVSTATLAADLSGKTLAVWVAVDNLAQRGGGLISVETPDGQAFDSIVFAEREPGRWFPGSNGYARSADVGGEPETAAGEVVQVAIVYGEDRSIAVYRNGVPYGRTYTADALATFKQGEARILFGLRHSPAGGDKHFTGSIDRAELFDRALSPEEVAALAGRPPAVSSDEIVAAMSADERRRHDDLVFELSQIESKSRLLEPGSIYAVAPQTPEQCHILIRGNPAQPGDVAPPAGLTALAELGLEFELSPDSTDAERRIALAAWMTDPANPLVARVIANRLWQGHFGIGLVDTPNDFGFSGGRPTHPELLDWLAADLIAGGWRLKSLHKRIVMSATYRQSSAWRAVPAAIDAQNRLLWRKSPQRLDAETLRDTLLSLAGELNPTIGGPGYRDFRTFTSNSQFYEPIEETGYDQHRRSVYRTWVRSGTNRFLDVWDCPDPSTITPRRAVTTTPTQSLALWNNSLVLRLADSLATRAVRESGDDPAAQIGRIFELAYSRRPNDDELSVATEFVTQHGLAALCRVVLNSNELVYVD